MREQQLVFYPPVAGSDLAALPPMATLFVRAASRSMLPPTQEQFAQRVLAEDALLSLDVVRARVSRTYPAFIRQWHLLVQLQVRRRVDAAHWIPDLDYQGVDLLVLHRGHALGVALSMRSDAAGYWQDVKARRHPGISGLPMLYVNVDPASPLKVGEFWVHGVDDVELIERSVVPPFSLPTSQDVLGIVAGLKQNHQLRAKAGLKDIWPVLTAVYERVLKANA